MWLNNWVAKSLFFLYPYSNRGKKIGIHIENKTQRVFYQSKKFNPGKFFIYDENYNPVMKRVKGKQLTHKYISLDQLLNRRKRERVILTIECDGLVLQTNLKSRMDLTKCFDVQYCWAIKSLPDKKFSVKAAAIWNYCAPNLLAFSFYSKFCDQTIKFLKNYHKPLINRYGGHRYIHSVDIGIQFERLWFRLINRKEIFTLSNPIYYRSNNFSYVMNFLYKQGFFYLEDIPEDKIAAIRGVVYNLKGLRINPYKVWKIILNLGIDLKNLEAIKPVFDFFNGFQLIAKKMHRDFLRRNCDELKRHGFFGFLKYQRTVKGYLYQLEQKILRSINTACFNYEKCHHQIHINNITRDRNWYNIRKMLLQHHYNQKFNPEAPQIQFLCCDCHKQNMWKKEQRKRTIRQLKRIFTNFHNIFSFEDYLGVESVIG